eukprot:g8523.t1
MAQPPPKTTLLGREIVAARSDARGSLAVGWSSSCTVWDAVDRLGGSWQSDWPHPAEEYDATPTTGATSAQSCSFSRQPST